MIQIGEIGIAMSAAPGRGKFERLEQALGWVQELGYRLVEVSIGPFALILDGELRRAGLDDFRAVLANFDLRYTVHGYNRLNLAYDPRHELCKRIMQCQIEIAGAVGAKCLVYHSGLQALDQVRHGVRRTVLSDEELIEGAKQEVSALKKLADAAADAGVMIGMENGDSHQWEHQVMAQFGLPREALLKHHARLAIGPIVQQLEAIDHPAVGMTLDIAHLHIAAHDMGFDYLDAVTEAAPWVCHLHANDNFGRLDTGFDNEYERWPYGEADIHLPPGWGSIPYAEVFGRLGGYAGDLILEIKGGFADEFAESKTTIQNILAELVAGIPNMSCNLI
jgi:sugar phosphate isomerase/epimerase